MCSGRSKEFPPFWRLDKPDMPKPIAFAHLLIKAMNCRHRFDYALTRGNQSENKICCQNLHVEANGKIVLAMEDVKTWEEMEVSLTTTHP